MNYVILESIIKSLVPIAIVVVLPIIMAWLSYRNKQEARLLRLLLKRILTLTCRSFSTS